MALILGAATGAVLGSLLLIVGLLAAARVHERMDRRRLRLYAERLQRSSAHDSRPTQDDFGLAA